MNILEIYCVFMYLFTAGICIAGFEGAKKEGLLIGMTMHFLLSPIVTPVLLGACLYEAKS